MKKRIGTFLITLALWFVFSWAIDVDHVIAGLIIGIIVAGLVGGLPASTAASTRGISRCFYFLLFLVHLGWNMVKGAFAVVYRLLLPDPSPHTGIVRVETALKSDLGRTFLAISISLVEGMLTVDIDEADGSYSVHLIDIGREEKARRSIAKYEVMLNKIFG
jgi:multisubunit Na+/H+ antiporter MnhE subunit